MNKNIKIILNSVLGPLVFLLLSYFICRQIVHQPNWRGSLDRVLRGFTGPWQWKLWLVLLLMPLNWGIEARKWQLALRSVGGISFRNALKAIFTGATMGSFTPNRMGEYLGRILYVKEGRRMAAISLTIVCSIAQLLITLVIGLGGIFYVRSFVIGHMTAATEHLVLGLTILLPLVGVALIGLSFVYFRLSSAAGLCAKIPRMKKYLAYLKILENFDAAILLRILFLSFGRYLVFMVQYSLVFPVFGVALGAGQVWGGMSVVFVVMAIIPTFTFLTELGLRWGTSIQVLELFSSNTVGIFATSFAIWLINLIIPALIGSLFIVSIKLFKSR